MSTRPPSRLKGASVSTSTPTCCHPAHRQKTMGVSSPCAAVGAASVVPLLAHSQKAMGVRRAAYRLHVPGIAPILAPPPPKTMGEGACHLLRPPTSSNPRPPPKGDGRPCDQVKRENTSYYREDSALEFAKALDEAGGDSTRRREPPVRPHRTKGLRWSKTAPTPRRLTCLANGSRSR